MTLPRFNPRPDTIHRIDPVLAAPQPPVAAFTYEFDGLAVNFQSQSFDPDGQIVQHVWDFGDLAPLPTAAFSAQPNGLQVTFVDQSFDVSPGTLVAWLWQFGDGTSSTTQHPVKTYAAGGAYNVSLRVTDNEGNQSTASQQVLLVAGAGIPIGAYRYFTSDSSRETVGTQNVLCGIGKCAPSSLIDRIQFCRSAGLFILPDFGGPIEDMLTNGVFDLAKWQARWNLTNTPAIKSAVAQAVADGIMPGAQMIDEPQTLKWGGYFSTNGKAKLDAMAAFSHAIHPTLPVGPTEQWKWNDTQSYNECDFIYTQYTDARGSITAYRDGALALGARDGHNIILGINVLNGGIAGRPCGADTGGTGTQGVRCRVTAAQLESWGLLLGAATRGLLALWRHDADFFGRADNQAALATVAAYLATRPRQSLKRGAA